MKNSIKQLLLVTAIAGIWFQLGHGAQAGIFGNKHSREYKKQKKAAESSLKKKQYETAEKHLIAAHAAARAEGVKTFRFTESIQTLGKFYVMFRMFGRAEPYFHMDVTNSISRFGTNRVETAKAWFAHAQILLRQRRFDTAVNHLERAERIILKRAGKYSPTLGYCRAVLGQSHLLRGDPEKAAPFLEQGLKLFGRQRSRDYLAAPGSQIFEIRTDVFTPNSQDAVICRLDYATALQLLDNNALAEEHIAAARDLLQHKLKEPLVELRIYRQIGRNYEMMGKTEIAKEQFLTTLRLTHAETGLTEQQKLKANLEVMAFYARQNEPSIVGMQRDYLISKGMPQADVDGVIRRYNPYIAARLRRASPTP